MATIEERVIGILAEQFCRNANEIDLSADLGQTYESDSLDLVELTMCIEDEFGFEIDDEVMWSVKTGQEIVDIVRAKGG